jgi:hypothetical protein
MFEFVSALVSILFGLGLTLLPTGAIERFYQRRVEFLRVCGCHRGLVGAVPGPRRHLDLGELRCD